MDNKLRSGLKKLTRLINEKKVIDEINGNIVTLKIHSLAPIIMNDADYADYKAAFRLAMKDRSINNIAITGEYGSGKSSVVETFLKKNFWYRWSSMRISLRNYESKNDEIGICTLEKKILNQIIMQMKEKSISGSGVYTKHHLRDSVKISVIQLFGFAILSVLYGGILPREPFLSAFGEAMLYQFIYDDVTKCWIIIVLLILIVYAVWRLLNQLPSGWFPDKVSAAYQGAELLIEKKGTSIDHALYDTYIDEIVYLLRKQKSRLLVIEDLDRFDNIEIFEQLREINFLINVKKHHRWNCKVKFIYLVKDGLFDNNGWDRTKFFDVIIPVAPCVGGAESWKKLKEMCPGLENIERTDKNLEMEMETFFQLHIKDYRMIKNIANEFNIGYNRRQRVGSEKFEFKKMLGMLVYKNLFPLDCAQLQRKNGYIYTCWQMDEKIEQISKSEEQCKQIWCKSENGDIRYTYNEVFSEWFEKHDDLPVPFSMKKEYWERLKEHSEYELLDKLIKNGYIEKSDYEQYIRILSTQDIDVLKLRKYSYAISHKMRTNDLQFDTDISEEMWNKLSTQIKQSIDYYNEALANEDIIRYMLNAIEDDLDVWWERTLYVASYCSEEEKIILYDTLSGVAKENWAVIILSPDFFGLLRMIAKEFIFDYVVHVLKGAGRYDRQKGLYEENGIEYSWIKGIAGKVSKRYPWEKLTFLEYIVSEKDELFMAVKDDEDALYVLLGLVAFGAEPLKVKAVLLYAQNSKLLMKIWQTDSFEHTVDNIYIFLHHLESNDMHLEKIKEICPELYREWMKDKNINAFVEEYYIGCLLSRAGGIGGRGFEEIRELLGHEALCDELKAEIILYLPENVYPKDLSEIPKEWLKKFIELGIYDYSLNNIVILFRENEHRFTEELCNYVEKCYKICQEREDSFSGLTIKLNNAEKKQMRNALQTASIDSETDAWISTKLELLEDRG